MKRVYLYIAGNPQRHIIFKGLHIINRAAKESNVYYIVRDREKIINFIQQNSG